MASKRFKKSRNKRSRRNRRQRGGEIDDDAKTLIKNLIETSGNPTPDELDIFIRDNNLTTIPRWDIINYIIQITGSGLAPRPLPLSPSPTRPPPYNYRSFVNSHYLRNGQ